MQLTEFDARLIDYMQRGIEIADRPFLLAAMALGASETSVLDRLQCLLESRALSRFGPMFNADALGGAYSLCAMSVPAERFDEVAECVNAFPEVAHNYQRDHTLNMWFVVATESPDRISEVIVDIEQLVGLEVLDFPKEEEYFIGLHLPLTGGADPTLEAQEHSS